MQLNPDHLRQPPFWNKVYRVRVLYSSLGLGVFIEGATFSGHKLLFVRQFDEDHLIVLGLGESVPVGVEMAFEANLRSKGSCAVWTEDGGCCQRLGGSNFPVLPALLTCSNPVGFMGLCATVHKCRVQRKPYPLS